MIQTRTRSGVEAVANVVVGFGLAFASQLLVFPALGLAVTPLQSVQIGGAFTAVSLVRSYTLRRLFDRLDRRG